MAVGTIEAKLLSAKIYTLMGCSIVAKISFKKFPSMLCVQYLARVT